MSCDTWRDNPGRDKQGRDKLDAYADESLTPEQLGKEPLAGGVFHVELPEP